MLYSIQLLVEIVSLIPQYNYSTDLFSIISKEDQIDFYQIQKEGVLNDYSTKLLPALFL